MHQELFGALLDKNTKECQELASWLVRETLATMTSLGHFKPLWSWKPQSTRQLRQVKVYTTNLTASKKERTQLKLSGT